MALPRFARSLLFLGVLVGIAMVGFLTRSMWLPLFQHGKPTETVETPSDAAVPADKIILNDQAQENLRLRAKQLKPQTYWRTIQIPGMIVDRPGKSEREVTAPANGRVEHVACFLGDTVRPLAELFTLKLMNDPLQQTQKELYKATQEIKLAEANRKRLGALSGAVPESRLIEIDNQITRLQIDAKASRQELLQRGFPDALIESAAEGDFITEYPVLAPPSSFSVKTTNGSVIRRVAMRITGDPVDLPPTFEVKELKVELGKQVQAGQLLCVLADHRTLAIEGKAFRDEMPLVERSAEQGWPAEIDFGGDHPADQDALLLVAGAVGVLTTEQGSLGTAAMVHTGAANGWFPPSQNFVIHRLSSTIDPVNRTTSFFLPLENQFRTVAQEGRTQTLWRYRPGQKVRILVRVERLDNVYVLPSDAVNRDGAEAFVFTQNVNTFERKPVRILYQDRQNVVIANDGSLIPGAFVVQTAAAQLSRMVKSGASGVPKGYHMHADGSLHKNEDEGK